MQLVITLSKTVADKLEAEALTNQLKEIISAVPEVDMQSETRDDIPTQ